MFAAKRAALLLVPALLTLTACGGEKSVGLGGKTLDGLSAVSVSGKVGEAPTVKWKGQMTPVAKKKSTVKVLVDGTGDTIAKGDSVYAYIWVGDGYSQKEAYNDYTSGSAETLTADAKALSPVFQKILVGHKIGSRVAAVVNAFDIFGEAGNTSLGVSNEDPLLIIVDITAKAVTKPTEAKPDAVPSVVEQGGKVTGLDFGSLSKPDPTTGPFLRATLKEGTGAVVTAADTVKVNYLGMVFGAKKPFDESYSKDPVEFGLNQVVKGWTYGLTGVKVGSRVVLQIPPVLGYGGKDQDKIPANSTLYFVVDVISATAPTPSASPSAN